MSALDDPEIARRLLHHLARACGCPDALYLTPPVRIQGGFDTTILGFTLDRVPPHIVPSEVAATLAGLRGVARVHDLHIWSMSTTEIALTAHLVMPGGADGDHFIHDTAELLKRRFNIGHATLQIERDQAACALEPSEVV